MPVSWVNKISVGFKANTIQALTDTTTDLAPISESRFKDTEPATGLPGAIVAGNSGEEAMLETSRVNHCFPFLCFLEYRCKTGSRRGGAGGW